MDILKDRPVQTKNETFFFRCIKAGFSQRRKTLLNSLQTMGEFNKEQIILALEAAGIEANRRAESLGMEEFAALADKLLEA